MRSTGLTGEGGYVDQLRSEPHCLFLSDIRHEDMPMWCCIVDALRM